VPASDGTLKYLFLERMSTWHTLINAPLSLPPPPSLQAINAFLKEMGLTADELLARPQLVDAIRE
jgi:hypothetical protein